MSFMGILIIQFFALFIPGPDFFLVARTGLTGSFRAVCEVVIGICCGAFIWIILSILGLHILFHTYPLISGLVMLFGACYLIYLAYGIVRRSNQEIKGKLSNESHQVFKGLMCNLSNPKAIIYYASIFSMLPLNNGQNDIVLIVILILIESFVCFVALGVVFSHPVIKRSYQKYNKKVDYVSAMIFVIFGLMLIYKFLMSLTVN